MRERHRSSLSWENPSAGYIYTPVMSDWEEDRQREGDRWGMGKQQSINVFETRSMNEK